MFLKEYFSLHRKAWSFTMKLLLSITMQYKSTNSVERVVLQKGKIFNSNEYTVREGVILWK